MPAHAPPRLPPASRHAGFTLVELLVAIGIVALLLAILIPAVSSIRDQSRRLTCLSNLRSMGVALNAYVGQSDAILPAQSALSVADFNAPAAPPNFLKVMGKFLDKNPHVYYCPAVLKLDNAPGFGGRATEVSDTSYVGNGALLGMQLSRIRLPHEQIWVQELRERISSAELRPTPATITGSSPPKIVYALWHDSEVFIDPSMKYQAETVSVAHGNSPVNIGGNVLYVDGHAGYRPAQSLRSGDFGLKPDQPMSHTNSVYPDGGGNYLLRW